MKLSRILKIDISIRKLAVYFLLSLVIFIMSVILQQSYVRAAVSFDVGYFSGVNYWDRTQGMSNGLDEVAWGAFSYQTDKATFIQEVKTLLVQGDATRTSWNGITKSSTQRQNQIAAAFIIGLMGKGDGPGYGPNPKAEDIKEWEDKINNPAIKLKIEDRRTDDNTGYIPPGIGSNPGAGGVNGDAVFYRDGAPEWSPSLIFYDDKAEYFTLKLDCGNPLGSIPLPPPPPDTNWNLSATSNVRIGIGGSPYQNINDAKPFDYVYWGFSVTNEGPDGGAVSKSHIKRTGWSNEWDGIIDPVSEFTIWLKGGTRKFGFNGDPGMQSYTVYRIEEKDLGKQLCQQLIFKPSGKNNSNEGSSPNACVSVPYNYELDPTLSISNEVIESGSNTSINTSVKNNGTKSKDNTKWQLTQITIPPNTALPVAGVGNSDKAPCAHFGVNSSSCVVNRSDVGPYPTGAFEAMKTTSLNPVDFIAPDVPVGTKYCFALSVQPYSHNNNDWRHSALQCVTIGKKPKVQIWGGDVMTDGAVITSTSIKNPKTYGSWVEYAIFSKGVNKSAGSGSGLTGGNSNTAQKDWSKLTFASKDSLGNDSFGNYGDIPEYSRPAITSHFTRLASSVPVSSISGSLTGKDGIFKSDSSIITIEASDINSGKSVIIVAPSATVKITGNIKYDNGPFNNINDIPQVVIIAKNIEIADNVNQVDAWLIANRDPIDPINNGYINTCNLTAPLTANICNIPLVINGPVMSDKLHLRRTAGSGTGPAASGDPAEVINLRADAYLWERSQANSSNKVMTDYTYEIPPRF